MERSWRREAKRYGAPIAFLLAVTVAVLLVRSGLQSDPEPTTTAVRTQTVSTPPSTTPVPVKRRRYYRLRSGETLWNSLIQRYDQGVSQIATMNGNWSTPRPFVDPERHAAVARSLRRQLLEAEWWRNASIAYFQSLSGLPLPRGHAAPPRPLSWYEGIRFDTVPGFLTPRIGPCRSSVVVRGDPPCAP